MQRGRDVIGRIMSMDFSQLELRAIGAAIGSSVIFVYDREMTPDQLQRYLGFREMGLTVTARDVSREGVSGRPSVTIVGIDDNMPRIPTKILIDDVIALNSATFDIVAQAKEWDTKIIQCRDEPLPIQKKHMGLAHQGVPQSKGARHANRRYRWC